MESTSRFDNAFAQLENWKTLPELVRQILVFTAGLPYDKSNEGRDAILRLFTHGIGVSGDSLMKCLTQIREDKRSVGEFLLDQETKTGKRPTQHFVGESKPKRK